MDLRTDDCISKNVSFGTTPENINKKGFNFCILAYKSFEDPKDSPKNPPPVQTVTISAQRKSQLLLVGVTLAMIIFILIVCFLILCCFRYQLIRNSNNTAANEIPKAMRKNSSIVKLKDMKLNHLSLILEAPEEEEAEDVESGYVNEIDTNNY
jgi:hypothetical protein